MSGQRSAYCPPRERQSDKPRMEVQRCMGAIECECTPEALGYTIGKTLGCGTYAKVKAAWSPHQRRMIAIKVLNKNAASKDYLTKFLPREIDVIRTIQHPNIIHLYGLFKSERYCYFLMELAENGDLLDYINARGSLPEPEARHVFRQMARAIAYCHSVNVIHRDLKCENIMLSRDMDVKIGDFGFALRLDTEFANTPCGSYSYAAPELFTANGGCYDGKKADVWSLGVILYAMVCGRLPFGDDSQVKMTTERRVSFGQRLPLDCRSFILSLLNVDVDERLSSMQLLQSTWPTLEPAQRPSPVIPAPGAKYTIENCLPREVQFPRVQTTTLSSHAHMCATPLPQIDICGRLVCTQSPAQDIPLAAKAPKPLVAKIGACGRKIADAVKHRGHGQQHKDGDQKLLRQRTT